MVHLFLDEHANGAEHGKTAITKLLRLHACELNRVRGLEAERVKSDIAGVVVIL